MNNKLLKKLVRDKIPEIIQESGKNCDFYQLDPESILSALMEKLKEEVSEFLASQTKEEWLEELSDVQEVILALLHAKGLSFSNLEEKRLEKRKHRGGFKKGYFLNSVGETPLPTQGDSCLFCDLAKQDHLMEFDHCYAIYDVNPVSQGHVLIIPKHHFVHWFETPKEAQNDILNALPQVKAHLDQTYQPDGYNVGFNCGDVAGQTVFHLHVHVIPRYQGDVEDPTGGVRGVIPSKQKY